MLLLPPESLKSQKTVFSDNHGNKLYRKCETEACFRYFYRRKSALISAVNSNGVKIRMWSRSQGNRLQRIRGLIKIP